MSIRVLIADDQSMVRAGFRMLLTGEHDIEVVAEASNGLEAVAQTRRLNPAVVLMDIQMPEIDGLEATRRILAADSAARILILTTFGLDEYVAGGLAAGIPPGRLAQASHPGWLIVAACGIFLFAAARAARPAAGRAAAGLGGRSPVPAGRTTVR